MKNGIIRQAIIVLGSVFFLSGCSHHSADTTLPPVKVEVEKLKAADVTQEFAYSGTIEESETIPLSFSSVGTVSHVYVSEGAYVRKGQLLAKLDNSTHQHAYEMAHAAELQAGDAYKRLTTMHNNGNLPDVKYVEVETGVKQASAAAAIAKKNLDGCNLVAVMDGFIGRRSIEPGMTALPNLVSITMVKINKVFARVSVPENEIARISKGQTAVITIGALGSGHEQGVVEEIGVMADPIVHSYKIKIGIDNSRQTIRPGMICTATIERPSVVRGVVVPGRAVMVDETGRNFVYVVSSEKRAVRKYVVIDQLLNTGIEVLDGLQRDESVVVSGQHKLVDHAAVQIMNE